MRAVGVRVVDEIALLRTSATCGKEEAHTDRERERETPTAQWRELLCGRAPLRRTSSNSDAQAGTANAHCGDPEEAL